MTTPLPPHPPLDRFYSGADTRPGAVRDLFDAGAPYYEWVCWLMSLGTGEKYRKEALGRAGMTPGMKVLDVATGTGLVLRSARELTGMTGLVIGVDPSPGMLRECRSRSSAAVIQGYGEHLPFPSASFDMVTMGYGLRHVADLRELFVEYARVLRPGGRLVILELTQPGSAVARAINRWLLGTGVPVLAYITTGSADARRMMQYFWETIATCVPPATILAALREAGFIDASRQVTGGVLSEYTASNAVKRSS